MLKQIAMVAVALVMVLSAVSVATADTNLGQNATKVGNFALYENSNTGALYNLSYVNDNYEAVIASSVVATGQAANQTYLNNFNMDNLKNIGSNLSAFTSGNENTLIMTTQSSTMGSVASITLNLLTPATKVNLTASQQLYLKDHSGAIASSFLSNYMYNVKANGTNFILFSTQNAVVTNSGTTLTYSMSGPFMNRVFVGVSSASALKDTIEKEMNNNDGAPFSYNNTTGVVQGRFVSMDFNTTSGVISNYTLSQNGAVIFNSISATGNGTIGMNQLSPVFPTPQPIVVGSVLFYGNNTAVYQMHDNPALVNNFFLSNGTMNISVASGLNVSLFRPFHSDVEHEDLNSSNVNYTAVSLGDQFDVQASSTMVFVQNSTFKGTFAIHGAQVSVNKTTGMISITTNNTAKISFVAPPGLQQIKKDLRDSIQYAIEHGRLAAVVVLGGPGNSSSNLSVSYNSSMQVQIQNVMTNSVTVRVNSATHEGTNFAIFVPNGVISNNSQITLKFDNQTITLSKSMGNVVNATSTTQASFYYAQVSGGTLVVIHVPHFSTHTIQISTASSTTGGNSILPSLPGNAELYIAVGILGVIAVVAVAAVVKRK